MRHSSVAAGESERAGATPQRRYRKTSNQRPTEKSASPNATRTGRASSANYRWRFPRIPPRNQSALCYASLQANDSLDQTEVSKADDRLSSLSLRNATTNIVDAERWERNRNL